MARFLALRDVIMGGNVVVGEVAVLVVAVKCRPGEECQYFCQATYALRNLTTIVQLTAMSGPPYFIGHSTRTAVEVRWIL